MKQTAVEFLVEEFKEKLIGNNLPNWVLDVIQQAKEMEKQQITNAYIECWENDGGNRFHKVDEAEQYYNETFKSE